MVRYLASIALATLLCSTGCTPVRTVYDAQGAEVKEDDGGGETDLMSVYEKRFNNSFSVKKTEDGVPQTVSNRVSSFQSDLEKARKTTSRFSTNSFDTGTGLDLKSKGFDGANKEFATGKAGIDRKNGNTMFSRDMKPDFMNESHGISHSNRFLSVRDNRARVEGRSTATHSYHLSESAPYSTSESSNYFESRRYKAEQPVIIDHREYYKKHKQGIRELLGRENPTP